MGLFSSRSSNTSSTNYQTTNNFFDQRSVNDAGGGIIGSGSAINTTNALDMSDRSSNFYDASNRSTNLYDLSDRSFTDRSDNSLTFTDFSDRSFTDRSDRSFTDRSDRSTRTDDDTTSIWSDTSNRSVTTINTIDPGTLRATEQLGRLNTEFLGAALEGTNDSARALGSMAIQYGSRLGESVTNLYAAAGQNTVTSWGQTIGAAERLTNRLLDQAGRTVSEAGGVAQAAIAGFQPAENKAN